MGSNGIDAARLEELISRKAVFLWDRSALCANGFKSCIQTIIPIIRAHKESFIVPDFVKKELSAPEGTPALMMLDRNMFLVNVGNKTFANLIPYLAGQGIRSINIFINDESKGNEIRNGSPDSVKVFLLKIADDGEITSYHAGRNSSDDRDKQKTSHPERRSEKEAYFSIKIVPERIEYRQLTSGIKISEGSRVFDSTGREYILVKKESVNNGGVTYSSNQENCWVKIFDDSALSTFTQAKIERMLKAPFAKDGICWPIDIAKDEDDQFRGYIQRPYAGYPLHLCIFKRAGIDQYFSDWEKIDLCTLAETILKKVEFLHRNNVLFGCINPASIRVVSQNEVYFTDTDNYQIDGFPSLAHNISFTPPELLDRKIYLATKENENFAVAELAFMLLMPGKTPYAVGSSDSPENMIKAMQFPYSNGKIHGNHAMPGMWRFMWSHLSILKDDFYNVFSAKGSSSKPEDRKDVRFWQKEIAYYEKQLQHPEDPEQLKIYPRTFHRRKDDVFYKCPYCGIEHPRFYFSDKYFDTPYRICNGCLDKRSDVSFTCKTCGKTYYYTNRTAIFHKMKKMEDADWRDQKHCKDCKQKTIPCKGCGKEIPFYYLKDGYCPDCSKERKNEVYKWITCRDCGRSFEFTVGDHDYFLRKGLNEPTRCPECRQRRKNGGGGGSSYGHNNSNGKGGGLFGWLFS